MAVDFSVLDGYSLQKKSDLTALANVIRAKTGITDKLTVLDMAREVNLIEVGGGETVEIITYLNFAKIDGGYEITGLNDTTVTDIIIPSKCNGEPVIRIGDNAFGTWDYISGGGDITSVIILDGVTNIGNYAFGNCYSLTTVVFIGNSITDIGEGAFMGCPISGDLILPDSVTFIGNYAFQEIGATSVVIPENVSYIGNGVFLGCPNLKTVTFKGTPTTINPNELLEGTFAYCPNLTDIYVPWSEGEVDGAPWGAENATIHYNSEV
ncbi:MAG: leucine-rich repeat domain-containing protein [Clostridia bacterium]|nr:leucine-rich repeat domain-containing protein [Clostridia bacterium]